MKSVVVIVLSWNRRQAVMDCIALASGFEGADVHVVVVDNASSDGSVAAIRTAHPGATLLVQPTNLGFAGGVNVGLVEAARRGADYAFLLNDDTQFDSTVLSHLLEDALASPDTGLLSPQIHDIGAGGGEQFLNGLIDWDRGVMKHNVSDADYRRRIADGATPIVAGTALLCDMRVYRAIGPFDERFFAYWEDTDYAIRAAHAGFRSAVARAARVRHRATATRDDRPPHYVYYMIRNEAMFWRLHAPATHRWWRNWLSASLEWAAQSRDRNNIDNAHACADAIWHALTRRVGQRERLSPAPRWARRLILAHPYLLQAIVRGDWALISRRLFKRQAAL